MPPRQLSVTAGSTESLTPLWVRLGHSVLSAPVSGLPESETIRVMGLAFEMALIALRLADRDDLANEVVAQKIIALAKAGERDPERLCDGVMKDFGQRPLL